MSRRAFVAVLATVGCMQAAPHAVVQITPGVRGTGGAVLVMPTVCVPQGVIAALCTPATMLSGNAPMRPVAPSYAAYVDPALRLKLEFAGYTLAEGAAMRLDTGERTDTAAVDGVTGQGYDDTDVTPSRTVAELGPDDVQAVARSLGLGGIVTSTFTISPAGFGEIRADLVVTLWDLEAGAAKWVVRCGERMYGFEETPARLASCVGNGVLAALAPQNLIGQPL